jgi:predicted RNA-binding Zn-ribbon protein involved in translation (DUF1610 family)
MNCPHCGADIIEEIDDFDENTACCFGFVFVCPRCGKSLGVRTGNHKKAEELR